MADQFAKNTDAALRRFAGLALVQCQLSPGQYDEATPVVARLKELYPGDAEVLYEAAHLHMRTWK